MKKTTVIPGRRKKYNLLFMTLPFMVIVLLFNYVPIFGWIYSVFDYIPGISILECDFVGLDYFRLIFRDANVVRTLKNTFIFADVYKRQVIRIQGGVNPGITELVLRDY